MIIFFLILLSFGEVSRLKYEGGDWYNDPSSIPNLIKECNNRLNLDLKNNYEFVTISQAVDLSISFLFITGHGEIFFNENERNLFRQYINEGGFVYVDDDYGLNSAIKRELKLIFPENPLKQISKENIIFHWPYDFPEGLVKIHLHDEKPPEAWGIEIDNRIAVFFTYESNVSDGWVDPGVHNDPYYIREKAFMMGINIICYAMIH